MYDTCTEGLDQYAHGSQLDTCMTLVLKNFRIVPLLSPGYKSPPSAPSPRLGLFSAGATLCSTTVLLNNNSSPPLLPSLSPVLARLAPGASPFHSLSVRSLLSFPSRPSSLFSVRFRAPRDFIYLQNTCFFCELFVFGKRSRLFGAVPRSTTLRDLRRKPELEPSSAYSFVKNSVIIVDR